MTGPNLELQILKLGMVACIIISFAEATVAGLQPPACCAAPSRDSEHRGRSRCRGRVDQKCSGIVGEIPLDGRKAWSGKHQHST
jgi:hypothetical protein